MVAPLDCIDVSFTNDDLLAPQGQSLPLWGTVGQLMDQLTAAGVGQRPVIFVCHRSAHTANKFLPALSSIPSSLQATFSSCSKYVGCLGTGHQINNASWKGTELMRSGVFSILLTATFFIQYTTTQVVYTTVVGILITPNDVHVAQHGRHSHKGDAGERREGGRACAPPQAAGFDGRPGVLRDAPPRLLAGRHRLEPALPGSFPGLLRRPPQAGLPSGGAACMLSIWLSPHAILSFSSGICAQGSWCWEVSV